MGETKEDLKKVLVCETYKKINGDYPKLYLLPLCDTKEHGTIFLGSCAEYELPTDDYSDTVWKFGANGEIESAMITKNLSYLTFRKTPYKFASGTEEKSMKELFGGYEERYQKVIDEFGKDRKIRRLQKYVAKHPQLKKMKRLAYEPKKIAAILTAAGIAISGIGYTLNQRNSVENEPINSQIETMIESESNNGSNGEYQRDIPFIEESKTENSTSSEDIIIQNNSEFEEACTSLMAGIQNVSNNLYTDSLTNGFFKKYSSTINPSIQPNEKGCISSIEELLYCYENDPERFATYGQRFMCEMSLDYMKIQLARQYNISNPETIKLTYETKIGAFEARVRENDRQLENPGFGYQELPGNIKQVRLVQGTRYSKLGAQPWFDFLSLSELEHFSDYGVRSGKYTIDEYNGVLLTHLKTLSKNIEKLSKDSQLTLTYEDDEER